MPSYLENRARYAADALHVDQGDIDACSDLLALRAGDPADRMRYAYHWIVTYAVQVALAHEPCQDDAACRVCYGLSTVLCMAIALEVAEAGDA